MLRLLVHYGQSPISAEREDQAGLIQLCRKGILRRYQSDWKEMVYVLPHAQLQLWQDVLFPPLPAVTTASSISSVMSKLSELLVRVWHGIMIHGLKKTNQNTYHKQYWNKILKHLPIENRSYPLEWLMEKLFQLQWIQQIGKDISVQHHRIATWFRLDRDTRESVVYELWKKEHFPREIWKQHILLQLERLPAGKALAVETCAGWLVQRSGMKWDSQHDQALKAWLDGMVEAGWIECVYRENSDIPYYRWFNPPIENSFPALQWIIQSDNEILIPPGANLQGLETLLAHGELVQTDPVWVFRVRENMLAKVRECSNMKPSQNEMIDKMVVKYEFPDYVYDHLRHFRPDTTLPKSSELYPSLRKIPSVWLNKCRGYHPATYRSIIEEALAHRGLLKVVELEHGKSGEQINIIPERLIEREGRWLLTATRSHKPWQLSLDQIKAMQLILPGLNDMNHAE